MQVTIVRLGEKVEGVQQKLLNMMTLICSQPALRVGAILMLGAFMHALPSHALLAMTPDLVKVIDETLRDDRYDTQCKRNATGLVQDLAGGLGDGFGKHIDSIVPLLHNILESDALDP